MPPQDIPSAVYVILVAHELIDEDTYKRWKLFNSHLVTSW